LPLSVHARAFFSLSIMDINAAALDAFDAHCRQAGLPVFARQVSSVCTPGLCRMWYFRNNVSVCTTHRTAHSCNAADCRYLYQENEGLVCQLTGTVHDHYPMIVTFEDTERTAPKTRCAGRRRRTARSSDSVDSGSTRTTIRGTIDTLFASNKTCQLAYKLISRLAPDEREIFLLRPKISDQRRALLADLIHKYYATLYAGSNRQNKAAALFAVRMVMTLARGHEIDGVEVIPRVPWVAAFFNASPTILAEFEYIVRDKAVLFSNRQMTTTWNKILEIISPKVPINPAYVRPEHIFPT